MNCYGRIYDHCGMQRRRLRGHVGLYRRRTWWMFAVFLGLQISGSGICLGVKSTHGWQYPF